LKDRFDDVGEFTERESFPHWLCPNAAARKQSNVKQQSDTKRKRTNYLVICSHNVLDSYQEIGHKARTDDHI